MAKESLNSFEALNQKVGVSNSFNLEKDYVKKAEKVMQGLQYKDKWGNIGFELTTTQIRNILSMVNDIYNEAVLLHSDELPEPLQSKIMHMKIRLVYESGRQEGRRKGSKPVKEFVEKANLLKLIDGIGDNRENFLRFAKYLEALVAYHKFYGGNEK